MQGSRRSPLDLPHPGRVLTFISITILAIDQVTKAFVRADVVQGSASVLVPGLVNLTHVHNVGAAFGLLPGRQPVFIATSCLVLFVVAAFWRRARPREWPVVIGLAMVTAGALGNLIDRVVLGSVTDFLEFAFVEFPVFNVADMAILGGVAMLAIWILFPASEDGSLADATTDGAGADSVGATAGSSPDVTAHSDESS